MKTNPSDHDAIAKALLEKHREQQAANEEFYVARQLADFAAHIEKIKESFAPALKEKATACAQKMHEAAELLAGDRAGEIYDYETIAMTEGWWLL